ncbi:MAG TPA: 50S ribosomal protein L9 [Chromatiaceae bacterium]|jgi:large subunit ribosomal protein L9|nr:50S ribosomal protein L9 [Chromatiaceae bacterium]
MQVILLKKVPNLGALGEKVAVRPGYGRNFLIPGGYAAPATEANLKAFEERRAELEGEAAAAAALAEEQKVVMEGLSVTIARKSGDEGRLFGSVGTADIAAAASEAGVKIERHQVRLPNGPLRAVGQYEIAVHLHADVQGNLKIEIVSES